MKFQVGIDIAIETMTKNLNEHITELAEAATGWTEKMIAALQAFRDAVDRKGVEASANELFHVAHARPKDNRKEYSKFLGALRLAKESGQSHVEVDEDDYDRMFNDNWDWRLQSKAINAAYRK